VDVHPVGAPPPTEFAQEQTFAAIHAGEHPQPTSLDELPAGLTRDDLLAIYRQMVRARTLDERLWTLQRAGRIPFVISGQGHEGAQVATAYAVQAVPHHVLPFYRSIAACLVFGMTPADILISHYARAGDPSSGGHQMPAHYSRRDLNIHTTGSSVATQITHAAGCALAARLKREGSVTVTYFGDGATSTADFHVGLNFAAIHRLPCLFVCENNGWAISVPRELQMPVGAVAERAAAYRMPGLAVDGTRPIQVYAAAKAAVDRALAGDGPTLLDVKVPRLTAHSSDDDERRYIPPEELARRRERDPLPIYEAQLRDLGALDDAEADRIKQAARAEIDQAIDWVEAQPDPPVENAARHVYAEGTS